MQNRSQVSLHVYTAVLAVIVVVLALHQPTFSFGAAGDGVTPILAKHDIPESGATLGHPSAPVTLIDFMDLECGPAAIYHRKYLPPLIEKYVRTGQVKIQLIDLGDEGPESLVAKKVFDRMAQQNLAWEWTDQVFKVEKGPKNSRSMTDEYIAGLFQNIPGADLATATAPSGQAELANLQRDQGFAQQEGVTGTPMFAVGMSGDATSFKLVDPGTQQVPPPGDVADALDQALASAGQRA